MNRDPLVSWGVALSLVASIALIALAAWRPAWGAVAGLIGGLAGLGAAAWFFGEDSRDPRDRDPFAPR